MKTCIYIPALLAIGIKCAAAIPRGGVRGRVTSSIKKRQLMNDNNMNMNQQSDNEPDPTVPVVALEARSFFPPWPYERFQDWSSVEDQTTMSNVLEYDQDSWNLPGEHALEMLSFETINLTSLGLETGVEWPLNADASPQVIATIQATMSITDEDTWDCYVNHYNDYFWIELEEYNVSQYFEALGWTIDNWEGDGKEPDTEDMDWFELDDQQTIGAEALCYFAESWAGDLEVSLWQYQPPGQAANSQQDDVGTVVTDADRIQVHPWDLPSVRFVPWSQLTFLQQENAKRLSYNETTWNQPGTGIEGSYPYTKYTALTDAQQLAAEYLEISPFYWDCLLLHYSNYAWNELPAQGVQGFVMTLGWTFESWHGLSDPPATEFSAYENLSSEQQMAAEQLCYLPETYQVGVLLTDLNLDLSEPP